ncbi:MAG: acyloxyacyl hydrolase [Bacteroidetes bacterium]|nr:acyloxyacyl hydrolase [Bacteroidota bacterium]
MSPIRFLTVICILLIHLQAAATDTTTVKQRSFELYEWGMTFGYGFVNEKIPEGNYGPFLIAGNIEFRIHRKQYDPTSPHHVLLFGEPQVVPVLLGGGISEWEAGFNVGLKYLIAIKESNGIYFHVGSGPHYISLNSPDHQAGGFAFSDNFGMGYERLFRKDIKITVAYRFRHISNLDIQSPNKGLDNHFFTLGFKKDFVHRVQQRRERKSAGLPEE